MLALSDLKRVSDGMLSRDGLWYTAFMFSSIGMQLLNKGIALSMSSHKFDNCLMIWQNGFAALLTAVIVQMADRLPQGTRSTLRMQPVTSPHIRRLFLPSVNFVLMLFCSLKALRFLHIVTVVVARNFCACAIAAGEKIVFGRDVAPRAWVSVGVCVVGSIIYAFNDLNFHWEGYAWQGLNSVLFIIGQLYEKWAMTTTTDQTPLGVSFIKNMWSLPIAIALALGFGEHSHWPSAAAALTGPLAVLIGLSGLGCFCLSITYMTLYKLSHPTSITVAANLNKVLTIIVAQAIFGGSLGAYQSLGLAICIAGSAWYSFECSKPKPESNKRA